MCEYTLCEYPITIALLILLLFVIIIEICFLQSLKKKFKKNKLILMNNSEEK